MFMYVIVVCPEEGRKKEHGDGYQADGDGDGDGDDDGDGDGDGDDDDDGCLPFCLVIFCSHTFSLTSYIFSA